MSAADGAIRARLGSIVDDRRVRRTLEHVALVLGAYLVVQLLWPAPAGVIVQGVVVGAMGSLLALGLALVYRANRIVNFAQADLGLVPASLTVLLTQLRGWPFWLSAIVGFGVSIVVGAVVQRLFVQRFFKAPRLILTVVTIGVSQLLIAFSAFLPTLIGGGDGLRNLGTLEAPVDISFTIDPIIFRGFDVLAIIVVPAVIGGLMALLRYTSTGIAIRASADSAERASLLGVPVARVQTLVWVAAAVLSFIGVLLRAGSLGVGVIAGPASGPLTLTRALGAAVIGRMENFGTILVASIGLGIVEQSIIWSTGSALDALVADFVILMAALLLQRRGRDGRVDDGEVSSWRAVAMARPIPRELADLPEVRWAGLGLRWGLVVVALVLPLFVSTGKLSLVGLVFVYALLGLSLVVLTGWGGLVSLGQAGLFGVGGAVGGALSLSRGWDMAAVLVVAGLVGVVAALVVGLPALRLRGMYLAVSTLGFSVFASSYLINRDIVHWVPSVSDYIERPLLGRIDLAGERAYYYVCLACFGLGLWIVRGVRNSRTGRVLIGIRDNERGAQAFGVNVVRAKLTAFAISGFLAAVAGALYVHSQQALGAGRFAPGESLRVFTMVVIGGMGSIPGALVGSLYLNGTQWFVDILPTSATVNQVILFAGTGIGVIFILLALPGGLGSLLYRGRDRLLRLVAYRRGIVVPSLVADRGSDEAVPAPVRSSGEPRSMDANDRDDVVLHVRDLHVGYDGVQVLFGVDLDVREGEIVALLGTNGAGKSTVLRAISGLTQPSSGAVEFLGSSVVGTAAHSIAARGLAQVPGGRGIFPSLTVAENLRIAGWMRRKDSAAVAASIDEAVERFPVLREKWHVLAGDLSGGQQQMLTLAQTFMTRPRLLMIDELSLGLAPVIVEELITAVKRMRDDGMTIVLVEQSVNVALTVADRAVFLEKGEVRFEGATTELLDRPDVLRSVFVQGAAREESDRREPATAAKRRSRAPVVLEVEGLTRSFGGVRAVDDVSFVLREGQVLGVIGPNGAGKTTVFDLISGFTAPDAGRVVLAGEDVTPLGADVRARMGLGRSFQDARLFPGLTVAETIAVAFEDRLEVRDPLAAALHLPAVADSERRVAAEVDDLVDLLGLGAFRDKFIAELSTGSRRIVDLACVLAQRPRVLLFDEPSSGIAQRETEALAGLLQRIQRETGCSILVIEHDMPLISTVADELIAMHLGRVLVRGTPERVLGDARVIETYLGTNDDIINRSGRSKPRRPPRARKLVGTG